jgi:ABC-type Na+ efflux pump permease subunit
MIIVIAIIAVMAGASMVTITLINSAKAKEAGVTLDSEISALIAKSKSQIPRIDINGDGSVSEEEVKDSKDYNFAIAVYQNKNDSKYYIAHGYLNSSDDKFYIYDEENTNDNKGTCISSRVSIDYTAGAKNSGLGKTSDDLNYSSTDRLWVIAFSGSGKCISGVGTYELEKASDHQTIDVLYVNANGSHQSK